MKCLVFERNLSIAIRCWHWVILGLVVLGLISGCEGKTLTDKKAISLIEGSVQFVGFQKGKVPDLVSIGSRLLSSNPMNNCYANSVALASTPLSRNSEFELKVLEGLSLANVVELREVTRGGINCVEHLVQPELTEKGKTFLVESSGSTISLKVSTITVDKIKGIRVSATGDIARIEFSRKNGETFAHWQAFKYLEPQNLTDQVAELELYQDGWRVVKIYTK